MTVKLFTHTDLDGVGCAIVAYHVFGENVDIEYCDYHEINEAVTDFIITEDHLNYDFAFITDISVNDEVAELIEKTSHETLPMWRLIDHHGTALDLNEYKWANVQTKEDERKASGTSLFLAHLNRLITVDEDGLEEFTETVRRYDTWEWQTKYADKEPKKLNDLLFILGRERFISRFASDLSLDFTESERLLLELEQEKIDAYVEAKALTAITTKIETGHYLATVFADRYQSELGNQLSERFPEMDAVAMINPDRSVSLRTIHDSVDVSAIAKNYGGGGHPKASGFPIPEYETLRYNDSVFRKER